MTGRIDHPTTAGNDNVGGMTLTLDLNCDAIYHHDRSVPPEYPCPKCKQRWYIQTRDELAWHDNNVRVFRVSIERPWPPCGAQMSLPDGMTWICTQPKGHEPEWQHRAASIEEQIRQGS